MVLVAGAFVVGRETTPEAPPATYRGQGLGLADPAGLLALIDPEGPEVIVHRLVDGILVEQARHSPGAAVTLDIGPTQVTLDPGALLS